MKYLVLRAAKALPVFWTAFPGFDLRWFTSFQCPPLHLHVNLDVAVSGVYVGMRGGKIVWSKGIATGEANMSHSLANLEHHHFKHPGHRRPGDAHVHFFGADAFSFGEGFALQDGDEMVVEWQGFGRALRNAIRFDRSGETFIEVCPL